MGKQPNVSRLSFIEQKQQYTCPTRKHSRSQDSEVLANRRISRASQRLSSSLLCYTESFETRRVPFARRVHSTRNHEQLAATCGCAHTAKTLLSNQKDPFLRVVEVKGPRVIGNTKRAVRRTHKSPGRKPVQPSRRGAFSCCRGVGSL